MADVNFDLIIFKRKILIICVRVCHRYTFGSYPKDLNLSQ